jgi:hypothetical protein
MPEANATPATESDTQPASPAPAEPVHIEQPPADLDWLKLTNIRSAPTRSRSEDAQEELPGD